MHTPRVQCELQDQTQTHEPASCMSVSFVCIYNIHHIYVRPTCVCVSHGVDVKQSMQSTKSAKSGDPVKKQEHTALEAACRLLSILHNLATSANSCFGVVKDM